ncbi:MAG: MFS transporter, partial [Candidatus Binatia bacterium]
IAVVALGFWSVALTVGALTVILPIYFASVGVGISKIALFFVFFKFSGVLSNLVTGVTVNRWGYRPSFVGALSLHTLISCLYLFTPALLVIYLERFVRGLIGMPLMSSVYVKHFSPNGRQRFNINMMNGLQDAAKGIGMFVGGVLIAVLPLEYSVGILGLTTAVATLIAFFYLPDLKEKARPPLIRIWGSVDRKIKILGMGRGLLHGARDAWGTVILPVYLTAVFGLSPTFVGTIMMAGLVLNGLSVTLFSKYVSEGWEPRKALALSGLCLMLICFAMAGSMPVFLFLSFVFLYEMLEAFGLIYYNRLALELSTSEQTSIDLAAYKTLVSLFKPVGVLLSGILAESFGFSWSFYLAAVFVFLSVLACLQLPKPAARRVEMAQPSVELSGS